MIVDHLDGRCRDTTPSCPLTSNQTAHYGVPAAADPRHGEHVPIQDNRRIRVSQTFIEPLSIFRYTVNQPLQRSGAGSAQTKRDLILWFRNIAATSWSVP